MSTAVIAFGSNLGDRAELIGVAREALDAHPSIDVITMSPLHESVAIKQHGADASAPAYLNAVARVRTDLAAAELLDELMRIERESGRERLERWGDRTLDLDIITYDNVTMTERHLSLPHPRAAARLFVLEPWLDIEPDARLGDQLVAELAGDLGSTHPAARTRSNNSGVIS
jgi:2-amino-4-hydroxy-6-hydroxymethyldihydropteridine diphosphokinase